MSIHKELFKVDNNPLITNNDNSQIIRNPRFNKTIKKPHQPNRHIN